MDEQGELMEMDQVYIELAPKAGTISQLRAEADAYRAARSAKPEEGTRFGRIYMALKAAVRRAGGNLIAVGKPITEE